MASSVFEVHVKMPGQPVRVKGANIGNGPVTAEWLAKHYEETNAFPGAEEVTVFEHSGKVLPLQELVNNSAKARNAPIITPKVKVTPKVKIGEARKPPENTSQPLAQPGTVAVVAAERTAVDQEEASDGKNGGRSQPSGPGRNQG